MASADPALIELELAVGFAADDEILMIDGYLPIPAIDLDEFDIPLTSFWNDGYAGYTSAGGTSSLRDDVEGENR